MQPYTTSHPTTMRAQLLRWCILVALAVVSFAAWGHAPVTTQFSDAVRKHFLTTDKKSYAMRKAKKSGKPLMVLLTKKGCGACQNLKQSANLESDKIGLTELLSKFVVVHAENENMAKWQLQGQTYAPQTYFYAPGEDQILPILGSSDKSPHFFHDAATLKWGMDTALEAVATGKRANVPEKEL